MFKLKPNKTKSHALTVAYRVLIAGLGILFVCSIAFSAKQTVFAAPSDNLNFQARIYSSSGNAVPDGMYNIEFKIYDSLAAGASAQGACVGGGTDDCVWVESRTGANQVQVKNGYFSVALGDVTAFPTINWDQELFLTMNIGGTGGSPTWDGEMTPRIQLTAVPYAFQANYARELSQENNGFTGSLTFDTLTTDRNILLPNASGTVLLDSTLAATAFIQNGNSFGQAAVLGTNDTFDLQFETDGVTRLTIDTSGNATLTGNLTVNGTGTSTFAGALEVDGNVTLGDTNTDTLTITGTSVALPNNLNFDSNTLFIDAANNRVSIGSSTTTYDLTFGGDVSRTIGLQVNTANATGGSLTITAGSAGAGANAYFGGDLFLQGGDAAGTGTAHGGNVYLTGGDGVGAGTRGLVVIGTPTFTTAATQVCAGDCTITQANIDENAAVVVNVTSTGSLVTLPDPGNAVAGRMVYVTASNGSQDFTLRVNGGGAGNDIAMRQNTTATMIWNGTDWTAAGASSSTTLQAAYDNTLTAAGGAEIILNNNASSNGLTVRNNSSNPIIGEIFEAQTSIGSNLFSVNNNAIEYASNGGAETAGASSSTFPSNTWAATPSGGTVSRYTTIGDYVATGQGSVSVVTSATANEGASNRLSEALTPNLRYTVSFATRASGSSFDTLDVVYSPDGTNAVTAVCATAQTVNQGAWGRVSCSFDVPASGITAANAIFIRQSDAVARTFYIENLSVTVKADVNHAVDGSVDDPGNFATNWTAAPTGGTVTRDLSIIYDTSASTKVATGAIAGEGVRNNMSITPTASTQYLVTFYARSSNTFDDIRVRYSRDGGTSTVPCVDYNTRSVSTVSWTRITCLFTADGSAPTDADLIIDQETGVARDFYIDGLSVTLNTNTASNVKIGGGSLGGPTTLLTLDRSAGPPVAANNDAYLGSMYYDTVTGRIQCYEAGGWGTCGAPPDNIVNLNPEYAGSVLNGTGVGTMTADVCANETGVLQVNDTLCASGEARNYYRWTSPQSTQQTYSIYITYQLPNTFDGFANDETVQLTGRVDNTTNAAVTYQMFRSENGSITQCGTGETNVATTGNTWQTVGINGNEATGCSFTSASANGFVLFKLNLKAHSNANAYVSTLTFTTTGR